MWHLNNNITAIFDQQTSDNRWLVEAYKFREVMESEAMRWGGQAELDQWSFIYPYAGTLTFSRGVEHYRRLMGNVDLVRLNTVHETNSLFNLLTVAYSQGLYSGNPEEYDTPYSTP